MFMNNQFSAPSQDERSLQPQDCNINPILLSAEYTSELQSICANFGKLCIPKNAVEEHDFETISLKENSIYE